MIKSGKSIHKHQSCRDHGPASVHTRPNTHAHDYHSSVATLSFMVVNVAEASSWYRTDSEGCCEL